MKAHWSRRLAAFGAVAAILAGMALVAACGDDDDSGSGNTPTAVATVGKLSIMDPWVRTTTNDVTAGYFTVKNSGEADTLVSAKASITDMVQLHEVVTSGSTSTMQEKPGGFPVPANGTLTLAPGGYHLMMMNLKSPLKEGDTVQLELTFKNAGTVKFTAMVKPGAGMSADMGSSK